MTIQSEFRKINRASGSSPHQVEAIGDAQVGNWIYLNGMPFTVQLFIDSGGTSGKVQCTMSLPSEVADDTARVFDWEPGEVTEATRAYGEGPITAVRGVSVSGPVTIEVCQA